MIPIVRAIRAAGYKRVVGVMGAQMGKTDNLLNAIGHRVDDDPVPIIYIGPTRNNVERVIEPRLMALFRSASTLWSKLSKGKASSKTHKNIAGVSVRLGWAGSATELAAQAAGEVYIDERDRMANDVGGEGDPVEQADARHATYPDGTTTVTSTPTVGNVSEEKHPETGLTHWAVADGEDIESPIWKLWQEGTRYEWAWPCPECSEYFVPRFSLLWWPEDATDRQAARDARMTCPHCGAQIEDKRKTEMNARGVYVAPGQRVGQDGTVTGEAPESDVASFWVSGLCSPWRSFGDRAAAWIRAVRSGDPTRIQAVLNVGFGELYKTGGDAPDWEQVAELRQGYALGEVPADVQVLTCSVDVQKNRLVYAVRGWASRLTSYLIEAGELWGETEHDAVWGDLSKLLDKQWGDHRIRLMLVDSGYRPGKKFSVPVNQVYSFCRRHAAVAKATKGHDQQDKPVRKALIDVSFGGKVYKRGLELWHLDSDYFKSWVHGRLEWPVDQSGGWHLPHDVTDDYCQQVVAEARTVKPSGKVVWVRIRKDNHFLDCEAMNVAAAHILQLHLLKDLAQGKSGQPTVRGRRVRSRGL